MNLKNIIFVILTSVVVLAGCIPTSVNPLYFKKDLIFDPELVGTWGHPNNLQGDRLIFMRTEDGSYTMYYYESEQKSGEPGSSAEFEAHLLRLGDNLLIDVFPKEPETSNDFYKLHFVPTHSFMRIDIAGDTLKLGLFDFAWLEDNLESGKVKIKHEYRESQIILTASTEELQKFVMKYADVAFPFDKEYELRRLY